MVFYNLKCILLALKVSIKKSTVILINFLAHVTFSLVTFDNFPCIYSILTMT